MVRGQRKRLVVVRDQVPLRLPRWSILPVTVVVDAHEEAARCRIEVVVVVHPHPDCRIVEVIEVPPVREATAQAPDLGMDCGEAQWHRWDTTTAQL